MKRVQINLEEFMKYYEMGLNDKIIAEKFNVDRSVICKMRAKNNLKKNKSYRPPHSVAAKEQMSLKRKEWLKNNPDRHPWRNKDKHQSVPCQKVKDFLKSKNVLFVEEYAPEITERYFSIDIALPDKKIALEINGNQHYERDGNLKPYYQERHDLLENNGWIVYELHYSICFSLDKLQNLLENIQNNKSVSDFDYHNYIPTKKPKHLCACGAIKSGKDVLSCDPCFRARNAKVKNRPSKEELEKLIEEIPMTKIGEMFGVSSVAVKKWAKKYQINLPNKRGFWAKKYANKI